MEKIQCAARNWKKIFPNECNPNPNSKVCQKCAQFVKKSFETMEPEGNSEPAITTSRQNVSVKKSTRRVTSKKRKVPRITSPEIIQLKSEQKANLNRLKQLEEKLYPRDSVPSAPPLNSEERKALEEERVDRHVEYVRLNNRLREEKIKLHGESHYILSLIQQDRGILRKDPDLRKIFLKKIEGEDFRKELAAIAAKPPEWRDCRRNYPLFDFIETAQINQPNITFGEMHEMVERRFPGEYKDAVELRRQCSEWGFKFISAKRGKKPKS